jgi:hypothetical protein
MSDTHALDHHAVLLPIKVKAISRPVFDNTHIDRKVRWIHENAARLARYWSELANGEQTKASDAELNCWLMCQYEIEVIHQARARLPHGENTL